MILYSKTLGQGNHLVILHGLFGSSDNWQTFAKAVSHIYTVTGIDLRNHGRSDHTDDFSYALIAKDLEDTLKELGIHQCILMGHSMGGKAAAYFAIKNPPMVKSLWIIDIAMRSYPPHHQIYFDAMLSLDLSTIQSRQEADTHLQLYIQDQTVRQFILKNLMRNENNAFHWRFNLAALYTHYDEINKEITSDYPFDKTVYFVKGEYSNYITATDELHIKQLFPQAQFITIPAAGHWIHADQPEVFKSTFLSKSL